MMVNINSFLLSIFTPQLRLGPDVKSAIKRSEILAIIYVNLGLFLIVGGYDSLALLLFRIPGAGKYTVMALLYTLLSTYFLHKQNFQGAASVLIPYIHTMNFLANYLNNLSLASLFCLTPFAYFSFLLTLPRPVRKLNGVLCLLELVYHVHTARRRFFLTLTEDQAIEISAAIAVPIVSFFSIYVGAYVQKASEVTLSKLAYSNYERSENLTKEAVKAAASKDAFVSLLSKEIKSPLRAMNENVELLLKKIKDSNNVQTLLNIQLGGEVLLNLLNNFLDAVQLRSGLINVSYSRVNLQDIIKKVFLLNSENLRKSNIFAQALIGQDLPKELWADSSKLVQIIMNLVSNMTKFTTKGEKLILRAAWCKYDETRENLLSPIAEEDFTGENNHNKGHGHRQPLVKLRSLTRTSQMLEEFSLEEAENRSRNFSFINNFKTKGLTDIDHPALDDLPQPWAIYRTDSYKKFQRNSFIIENKPRHVASSGVRGYLKVQISGVGCNIATNNIIKLFEIYSQNSSEATTLDQGVELELWICKQMCQKLGGDIKLSSRVNYGTTFVFYIPINNTELISEGQLLNSFGRPQRDKTTALVVDDYEFNRDLHKLLLEREGVEVTLACDGKEAVERYKAQGLDYFDFILMDVQMPEMDGFTAAKVIRGWEAENKKEKKIDIYFVSGEYFDEEEVMKGFKTTTKGGSKETVGIRCLRKPIDLQMIKRVVEKCKKRA